ncbi:hypothetical protein Vadar_019998 [Vaccinium darrowii]|uniref:Uncharacterized protein n=1 Tax=Vaccinium darrowii TaxID=229202 RepID=A0ACB7X2B4_9ERIC|nr:hypothetical protein Vadar_019998 [Vaccinium darrowii]
MMDMVKDMYAKFSKYWSDYSLVLSCAAILDPRYKVKLVAYCYAKLYGEDSEQRVNTIVSTLHKLFDEYMEHGTSSSLGTSSGCVLGANEGNRMVDDGFEDYDTFQGMTYGSQLLKSQLDLYLEEPCFPLKHEMDILEYWNETSKRYPDLAKMARDLLAIPVSTVASESTFSIGRRVISPFRSSLKPNTVQALICLQDWMRAQNREEKLQSSSKVAAETNGSSSSESDIDEDEFEVQTQTANLLQLPGKVPLCMMDLLQSGYFSCSGLPRINSA